VSAASWSRGSRGQEWRCGAGEGWTGVSKLGFWGVEARAFSRPRPAPGLPKIAGRAMPAHVPGPQARSTPSGRASLGPLAIGACRAKKQALCRADGLGLHAHVYLLFNIDTNSFLVSVAIFIMLRCLLGALIKHKAREMHCQDKCFFILHLCLLSSDGSFILVCILLQIL
jgi:hypothetical protein